MPNCLSFLLRLALLLMLSVAVKAQGPEFVSGGVVSAGQVTKGWRWLGLRLGNNIEFERIVLDVAPPAPPLTQVALAAATASPTSHQLPAHFWVEQKDRQVRIELTGYELSEIKKPNLQTHKLLKSVSWKQDKQAIVLLVQTKASFDFRAFYAPNPARIVIDLRPR